MSNAEPVAKKPLHPNQLKALQKMQKGNGGGHAGSTISPKERDRLWGELIKLQIRGATNGEAAQMLGFATMTIQRWKADPRFRLKLARTRKKIFEGLAGKKEKEEEKK